MQLNEKQLTNRIPPISLKIAVCLRFYFTSIVFIIKITGYFPSFFRNNIQCMTTLNQGYDANALYPERNNLPGQIYNADQQCEHMVGTGSVMCRVSCLSLS